MTTLVTSRPRPRPLVALVAALTLGLLASACSSDTGGGDTGGGAGGGAGETELSAGAYPVTIEHKFGSTEIAEAPERVVSLGYTEQDSIVLFGVQPVAVRYAFGPEDDVFFPWADEAAGDAEPEILPRAEINFEQIATLAPDVIMAVTAGLTGNDYDTLSQIAPTVVQPEEYVDFGTPWQEQTRIAGRVFGQADRAEEVIAEVEARFDEARRTYSQFEGRTFVLSGPSYEGEYPFHASDDARTQFFGELGFVVPPELDELAGEEFFGSVSRERADLLDADVLAWQAGSPEERSAIEADPVLSALAVVTEGRSLFVEGSDYDALQFTSALSLPFLLDSLLPKLAAAVDAG